MTVNFVTPPDIMSFDYGGRSPVRLPPNLAHAVVVKPPADIPIYARRWDFETPSNWGADLPGAGQADRTVVVFTADHGEMAGSHGLRQKGNLPYDENVHVPLVIAHPD